MDLPATQICNDDDFLPTQRISQFLTEETTQQIGVLTINLIPHPINRGINTIGRHPACNIVINDPTVSKRHAEIEASTCEGSTWICDLDSSNKTKLNNLVLRSGRSYELKDGSTVEFGTIRGTYKTYSLDNSLVPDTPMKNRKKLEIIPSTPDSSLNNSSALEEDISAIPATQENGTDFIFRRPSMPRESLTANNSTKSIPCDSSTDDSTDNSKTIAMLQRSNEGVNKTTVDMRDTQMQEKQTDIHDMETQKVSLDDIRSIEKSAARNINRQITDDIHDMETQCASNVRDTETCERSNLNGARSKTKSKQIVQTEDNICDKETQKVGDLEFSTQMCEIETQKLPSVNDNQSSGTATPRSTTKNVRSADPDISAQELQLSLTPNYEEECSQLQDTSMLGSQNLLEGFIGNITVNTDEMQLSTKTSTPKVNTKSSSCANEESNESDNEESIFDVMTQQRTEETPTETTAQHNDFKLNPFSSDDSETDEEGILQKFIHKLPQKSNEGVKNNKRTIYSDDSDDTDEEGQFVEMAKKQKQKASSSIEIKSNETKDDGGTSRDSDDIFEVPTQRGNFDEDQNDTSNTSKSNNINKDSICSKTTDVKSEVEESRDSSGLLKNTGALEDDDDTAPTQVISLPEAATQKRVAEDQRKKNDIVEDDDMLPTQIIDKKLLSLSSNILSSSTNGNESNDSENIDYEMAPTQLLSEITPKKKTPITRNSAGTVKTTVTSKRIRKYKSKVNLDDTLERNLNEILDESSNDSICEPQQMSTQALTTVLEESPLEAPSKNTSNKLMLISEEDSDLPDVIRHTKSGQYSVNNVISDNSQSSDKYFSSITTRRKKNVILDSQESVESGKGATTGKGKDFDTRENMVDNGSNENSDTSNESRSKHNSNSKRSRQKSQRLNSSNVNIVSNTGNIVSEENNEALIIATPTEVPNSVDASESNLSSKGIKNPVQTSIDLSTDENDDILAGLPAVTILGTISERRKSASPAVYDNKEKQFRNTKSRKSLSARRHSVENAPFVTLKNIALTKNVSEKISALATKNKTINNSNPINSNETRSNSPTLSSCIKEQPTLSIRKSENLNVKEKSVRGKKRRASRDLLTNANINDNSDAVTKTITEPIIKKLRSNDQDEKVPVEERKSVANSTKRSLNRIAEITDCTGSKKLKARPISVDLSSSVKEKNKPRIRVRRHSENLLDYFPKESAPKIRDETEQKIQNKNETTNTAKAVSDVAPNATKFIPSSTRKDKQKSTSTDESNNESMEIKGIKSKRNRPTRRQTKAKDIVNSNATSTEESQEVEMIMRNASNSLQNKQSMSEAKSNLNKVMASAKTRNTGNVLNDSRKNDLTESSNISSDLCESDNPLLEVPKAKAKRGRTAKRITPLKESITEVETIKQSPQINRRSIVKVNRDSSNEDSVEQDIQNLNERKNTPAQSKIVGPRGKRKNAINKDADKTNVEGNTSSGVNSSTERSLLALSPGTHSSLSSSILSTGSPSRGKCKILFTGITNEQYNSAIRKLGGLKVEDVTKCDVLVTDKIRRTVKFLCAVARAVPIVYVNWLNDSQEANCFLNWENYILKDPSAEAKFGFRLRKSLDKAKERKLLEDYTVVLTPNVGPPPKEELKSMILSCGGKALVRPPAIWPKKAVVISREEDLVNAKKFLTKAPDSVSVQSTEFILTGILKQDLDFSTHRLI